VKKRLHATHRRYNGVSGSAFSYARGGESPAREYGYRGMRLKARKGSPRKLKRERVLDLVRDVVKAEIAHWEEGDQHFSSPHITVEVIATHLGVEPGKVHWSFMKLNHEGLMERGYNGVPHDSNRETMTWCHSESAWVATFYPLVVKERLKKDPIRIPFDCPAGCLYVNQEKLHPKKKRYSKKLQRRLA
jgi:hypothetical protein